MAVLTKKKKVDPSVAAENTKRMALALAHYDLHLWGQNFKPMKARRFLAHCGVSCDGVKFRSLVKSVCKFWRNPERAGHRRKAIRTRFDSSEWYRMQCWVKEHKADIDIEHDTYASIARRMLCSGITTNAAGAREAVVAEGINLDANPKLFQ